jgi:hypothetical protein
MLVPEAVSNPAGAYRALTKTNKQVVLISAEENITMLKAEAEYF